MKGTGTLRHGSLFSGIGGFDLAADHMGWENIFHCETNPFCKRVLNYYYPKAESNDDIRKTDFKKYKGKIDVLTGGFPCQPYSLAGKRRGKDDPRHLWPEMLRAVQEIQPSWVVGENVRGLISWNGGMVFHEVHSDLEAEGYKVLPFLLPAAGINAPHRRERIWFIAYSESNGTRRRLCSLESKDGCQQESENYRKNKGKSGYNDKIRTAADTDNGKQQEQPESSTEDWQQASGPRCSAGIVAGNRNCSGRIARRIRQLAAGAGFLQTPPADSDIKRLEGKTSRRIQKGTGRTGQLYNGKSPWSSGTERWDNFPETEPSVRIGNDGLSGTMDLNSIFEGIPFPVKPISFSKWRTESIKALGNAIVPQVAVMLFKVIQIISNEL